MSCIILYNKPWSKDLIKNLNNNSSYKFIGISNKSELNIENLDQIKPKIIFVTHWSTIIPKEVFTKFKCVVFHMTDLPFGRGGSPLQNLITRGYQETKISAILCVEKIDAGPIYLKKPLSLLGSAEEIFIRTNEVIEGMIIEILESKIKPLPQEKNGEKFIRRKAKDGDWSKLKSLSQIYDYIRMLDADGYPRAFVKVGKYKLEFNRASRKVDHIIADVKITEELIDE